MAEEIKLVRELQGNLKQKFTNNELDLSFTESWGLETVLAAKPERLTAARTVASGHKQEDKNAQRHRYSLLYLEFSKDPKFKNRPAIEDAIVETINYCISVDLGNEDGFGKNWFKLPLGEPKKKLDHHLTNALGEKKFSPSDIEKAALNRAYNIPTTKGLKRLKRH